MRRAAAPFAANPQLHAKTLARHASISPPLLFSSPATSVALTYKHVLYQDKLNDEQHCVSSLAALQVMQIEPVNHGMEALGTSRRRWLRPSRRPELDENTTGGTPEKAMDDGCDFSRTGLRMVHGWQLLRYCAVTKLHASHNRQRRGPRGSPSSSSTQAQRTWASRKPRALQ